MSSHDTQPYSDLEPTPFRWSFSQWEMYNSCPAAWRFKYQLKLPTTPPGPAASRGLDMHSRVENYIMGKDEDKEVLLNGTPGALFGDKTPAKISPKYIEVFDTYKNHPNGDRWAEKRFAFDSGWYLCGPTSQHRACVGVLDAVRSGGDRALKVNPDEGVVRIGEWKSGKPKDTHRDQRMLYAMAGLKLWNAERVEVTTYYLEDTGNPQRLVVTAQSWSTLTALWDARVREMKNNTICAPKPSYACRWCDFSKDKGGPCKFG